MYISVFAQDEGGFAEHLMYTNELDKYTLLLYNIKKIPKNM